MSRKWDKNRWSLEEADVLAKLAVLRTAADESARHVRGLYFTFLLFAFYVAVIVFSTTDEQLLEKTGAKLPLLNVELPLLGFYIFIPWLVLLFHAHLLSQFYLLSRKLFSLDQKLRSLPEELERTQRGLPFPLIFSHGIIGTHHPGPIRWVFGAAVFVTILLAPILLLVAIQWKFLPYHSGRITFDHQLVLTLDLLLLWFFWPRLSSRSGRWRDWWSRSRCMELLAATTPLLVSTRGLPLRAFYPRPLSRFGRWRNWWSRSRCMRGVWVSTILGVLASAILLFCAWFLLVPHVGGIEERLAEKWLARDEKKWLTEDEKGFSWIHRNLELRERTLMRKAPPVELLSAAREKGPEKEAEVWLKDGEALDLRERDLRYADFSKSKLWDADLRGAQLQHAKLQEAQLQGAKLQEAQLQHANLQEAQLQGAILYKAYLQGAFLWQAQLQGADLSGAELQGATLFGAQLPGADLSGAELQGANLMMAQLQIADLQRAQLQGAHLYRAQLQGADLQYAQLPGAFLWQAQLQGADLRFAQLRGADLFRARLQGADLEEAQLQGADLREAVVYGTNFRGTELSLTDLRNLHTFSVGQEGSEEIVPLNGPDADPSPEIEWLEAWLEKEGKHWSEDGRKRVARAITRLRSLASEPPLEPATFSPEQKSCVMDDQKDRKKSCVMHDQKYPFKSWPPPLPVDKFEPARAKYRAGLACDDQYIAKRMWRQAKFDPVLEGVLRDKAESGDCSVLAEVIGMMNDE